MAFLPQRNYKEQTLANSYNLSNGITAFTSDNIAEFNQISLQFNSIGLSGSNNFLIEQSSDNSNWTYLSDSSYILDIGTGSLTIQKNNFSGKFIRVNFIITGNGILSIFLLTKR